MIPKSYGPHRAPDTLEPQPNWAASAKCATVDPEVMYPGPNDGAAYKTARDLCDVCPVLAECFADVMAYEGNATAKYRYGIRAGLTPAERANRHTRSRKQAAA
ncbi:WhiB family transcriptional regulator [Streptomyces sp. NBC_00249]|uniref:WhiB family transcriptional regulator n=1 Tax=Streptomyces sp. NBC_00249 TaxID=2975690 RepID=UPI00225AC783|nr:WhiB family transcriptional regulator [Streptomyces sp. NBC_00249]MCX5197190.1 WhiB family transcriptional regulator [Streptomyces sp. NBC_00249]